MSGTVVWRVGLVALGIQLVAPTPAHALTCKPYEKWRLPAWVPPVLPGNVGFWMYEGRVYHSGPPTFWDADDTPIEMELVYSAVPDPSLEDHYLELAPILWLYRAAHLAPGVYFTSPPDTQRQRPTVTITEHDTTPPAIPIVNLVRHVRYEEPYGSSSIEAQFELESEGDFHVVREVGSDLEPLYAFVLPFDGRFRRGGVCGMAYGGPRLENVELEFGAFDLAGNFSGWSAPVQLVQLEPPPSSKSSSGCSFTPTSGANPWLTLPWLLVPWAPVMRRKKRSARTGPETNSSELRLPTSARSKSLRTLERYSGQR